jgi:hypothetical protein
MMPLSPPRKSLRLVASPPQPRRIEVRIAVNAARAPLGRTRILMLRESDIDELIAITLRLERRP